MDTTGVTGSSSADDAVMLLNNNDAREHEAIIVELLEKQPKSWEQKYLNVEEILDHIYNGYLTPWLYWKNSQPVALMLFSFQQYPEGLTVRINFLSVNKFFGITKMLPVLEDVAKKLGVVAIEAVAADVLADFAVKKCGFERPAQYIYKPVRQYSRMN